MDTHSYGQFCPVAMAAEIFCTRWTALVLRELLCGATRFNDIRRGVPRMSPTLLSKRLKELEHSGIVICRPSKPPGTFEYRLSPSGEDLRPVVMSLGAWGHRWIDTKLSLQNLDAALLMLDMRRCLIAHALPARRTTVQFDFPGAAAGQQSWWLVIENGEVDLCGHDPGFGVDLHVCGSLAVMTAVWMGYRKLQHEIETGLIELIGDPKLASDMKTWLGFSKFAASPKPAAA